jgi:hypothetical protein
VIYLAVVVSHTKDVGSINGKDISFEDFRIKVGNVEKKRSRDHFHGRRK